MNEGFSFRNTEQNKRDEGPQRAHIAQIRTGILGPESYMQYEMRPAYHNTEQLWLFREGAESVPQTIYYPCSGRDASLSKVFPESKVIYTDINEDCVATLRCNDLEAYKASVHDFDPGNIDMLVVLFPEIDPEGPDFPYSRLLSRVNPGGYVIANNFYSSAERLFHYPSLALERVVQLRPGSQEFESKHITSIVEAEFMMNAAHYENKPDYHSQFIFRRD